MSRTDARTRALRRRPSRTVPAAVVAVVLLVVGVLVAAAAVSRLVDGRWPAQVVDAASQVAALTWGSVGVLAAGAVLALLGLLLLVAGLKPGDPTAAPLTAPGETGAVEDRDFVISTRALARLAAARADQVDGVSTVAASATGRRVHLRVATASEQTGAIRQQVCDAVAERLTAVGVRPVPRVSATVRTKEI